MRVRWYHGYHMSSPIFTMKKTLLSVLLVATFALPLAASATTTDDLRAQIQTLLAQIQTLRQQAAAEAPRTAQTEHPGAARRQRICDVLTARLSQGASGDSVMSLQEFLAGQGFLDASPTGFFGPLTVRALARFQLQNGIIAREDDGGEFGRLTAQFVLERWCGAASSSSGEQQATETVSGEEPAETEAQVTGESVSSDGITISSFTGPSSLDVERSGTWNVQAVSASGAALEYHITWGDETQGDALQALSELANPTYSAATSFSHAYSRPGTYQILLVVRDADARVARTMTAVRVTRPVTESGSYPWITNTNPVSTVSTAGGEAATTICQMDAKVCPDGTVLSRSGSSCTFPVCPLSQAAQQLIGVTMPGAGPPRAGETKCTYAGKTYSELQTYSTPVPCVEGTSGSICGTKVYYCHFGQWFLKTN